MKFEMSEAEVQKFREWREGVWKRGAEKQLAACATEEEREEMRRLQEFSGGAPYTGAIGGSFTFMFTPTSIATAVSVKDDITGEVCDLTDYGAW